MRFTKIPLIATLMAVALSLLIVLPTIAQSTDITDGRGGSGPITVGVFDDINDAQLGKLEVSTFDFNDARTTPPVPLPYVPVGSQTPDNPDDDTPRVITGVTTGGEFEADDASYLMNPAVDPQDTFFRGTLYVSNNPVNDEADTDDTQSGNQRNAEEGAYNTILINVAFADPGAPGTGNCVEDLETNGETGTVDESAEALVRAIVRNNRNGDMAELELVLDNNRMNAQGFVKIVPDDGDTDPTDGPAFCGDEQKDTNPAEDGVQPEEDADDATDDTIAQVPARHGDRITITVPGQSGTVELTVDGDGPDFSAITPEDNDVQSSRRLSYGFEVRDDDSGLRHDGESVITPDDDLTEVNPDGDQHLGSEPLSEDPGAAVAANGAAADIDVNVASNPRSETAQPGMLTDLKDISASGTWRIAGSRAGVAYSFTASGADKDDGHYLYQLRARDRAGNWSVTDADDDADAPGNQYFVFRVDDTDPDLAEARTGISYDREDDEETADRSYIVLDFGSDAIGDIDTDNITVVGHRIVSYIQPSTAPAINRNVGSPKRADYDPEFDTYTPAKPGDEEDRPSTADAAADPPTTLLSDAQGEAPADRTAAQVALLLLEGRWTQYDINKADVDDAKDDRDVAAPVLPAGQATEPTDCMTPADANDVEDCGRWDQHALDDDLHNAGKALTVDANERHTADEVKFAKSLEPGTDILGDNITEPRARIYIELAEELASDETPTVQVVGGAVFDLAGNTNAAKTLKEAADWIAPKLTVTVTGTAADRAVANVKGSFTIDVTVDEDVNRPKVYFVSLAATLVKDDDDKPTGYSYAIGADYTNEGNPLTSQEDENHWNRKYKVDSPDLSSFPDGLVGVVVVADDDQSNSGATAGWTPGSHQDADPPTADDKLSPDKMDDAGLLVEIDTKVLQAGKRFVTPRSDSDGEETESANPFVKLDFSGEGSEYKVCPADGCHADVAAEYKDTHSRVDVVEITVNGDDALASLARIDSNEFSLVLRDLEIGDYKVWYKVEDDAGNDSDEGNFTFEVKPRRPYEVAVTPGWNLVSLPATPLEPEIGNVLANNPYISPVLAYQAGDWVTAIQEEDGTWRGRLTEITGGYGYWIHARTFETIETMLAETDPASTLPTVAVTQGWNLLGVLDVYQNDDGEAPGLHTDEVAGDPEADNYLKSIEWRVAYTYDTTASLWVKTVPSSDTVIGTDDEDNPITKNEIENGMGYWVWSNTPGTLAP